MNSLPSISCRFVAFLSLSLSACSGTVDDINTVPTGGTPTGPTGGTSTGGTAPQTGGLPAVTGGIPSTGGTTPSTGGSSGGFANTGGQLGQGGSTGGSSGAPNGGTLGQGGTLSGGATTGGFFNGGTGGSSGGVGGQSSKGGSSSGGVSSGGKGSGGTGTGGKAAGGAGGKATGGTATGGTGGDPFGGSTVCTSKTNWTSGENQNMRPGEACIACHATNKGPDFNIAGTVYPTGHEPNDCNGKGGVTIVITDAKGTAHNITVNSVGNFNFTGTLPLPYTAKVTTSAGATRAMTLSQTVGDCNTCHTEKGANGAPGRIVIP